MADKTKSSLYVHPFTGEHDTTVRLKYPLAKYPHLTTTDALHAFMATFGPTDKDSIVLSMKPPKKAAHKPPKYATAAVPFKTVADAHAAVCASGRADRGLEDFEIGWVGGCEPAVWSWSERMLRLKEERREAASESKLGPKDAGAGAPAVTPAAGVGVGARGGLPQTSDGQISPGSGSQFSSFPSSFVRIFIPTPVLWNLLTSSLHAVVLVQTGIPSLHSSAPQLSAPGLDFESAVLMRMRQAERERLEREIREQEANEA